MYIPTCKDILNSTTMVTTSFTTKQKYFQLTENQHKNCLVNYILICQWDSTAATTSLKKEPITFLRKILTL
jgi:hypothetical protein